MCMFMCLKKPEEGLVIRVTGTCKWPDGDAKNTTLAVCKSSKTLNPCANPPTLFLLSLLVFETVPL